jgi:hypothetical protein
MLYLGVGAQNEPPCLRRTDFERKFWRRRRYQCEPNLIGATIMDPVDDVTSTPSQPPLAELMSRYLSRQAGAHAAGLAPVEATGEVVPFEAAPVQTVDPPSFPAQHQGALLAGATRLAAAGCSA